MTESGQASGKVIFTQALEIGYVDAAEMLRLAERRKFYGGLRRLRNGLLVLGIFVFLIWLMVHSQNAAAQRKAKFGQLTAEAAPYLAAHSSASQDKDVRRFAGQALEAWGRAVNGVSSRLSGLSANPDAGGQLYFFRMSLQSAEAACGAAERAMRQTLMDKSRAACPMHPHAGRDPREQVCPYAPLYHYRFEVWEKANGAYCWRDGKTVECKRLGEINLCGR